MLSLYLNKTNTLDLKKEKRKEKTVTVVRVWASLLRAGYTRYALGKVVSRLTPHGTIPMPIHPACCALRPRKPSSMPSCPAPPPPVRDPASSKGSQTWLRRPQCGPTSSCSSPWLSSFAPLPLASPLECPGLPPPSTPPQILSFSLPPSPPWPSRLVKWFLLSLILATAALRRLSVALGQLATFVSFVDC